MPLAKITFSSMKRTRIPAKKKKDEDENVNPNVEEHLTKAFMSLNANTNLFIEAANAFAKKKKKSRTSPLLNKKPIKFLPEEDEKEKTNQQPSLSQPSASLHPIAVFSFMQRLNWKEVIKCMGVCKDWNITGKDEQLWMWMVISRWKNGASLVAHWRQDFKRRMLWENNLDRGHAVVSRLKAHRGSVCCMALEGDLLVSASDDGVIRTWIISVDSKVSQGPLVLNTEQQKITCMAMSRAINILVCGTEEGGLFVWKLSTGERLSNLCIRCGSLCAVLISGKFIISASCDCIIRVMDLRKAATAKSINDVCTVISGHRGPVYCIEATAGDNSSSSSSDVDSEMNVVLVSGSRDADARVWDLKHLYEHKGNILRHILKGHSASITVVKCQNGFAFTGSDDYCVRMWSLKSGAHVMKFVGHQGPISGIAFRPTNMNQVLIASFDGFIRSHSLISGTCDEIYSGHKNAVLTLQVMDTRFVSSSNDRCIRIWNPLTPGKTSCYVLQGHFGGVGSLLVQNNVIVSASDDTDIRIWDFRAKMKK